MNLFEAIRLAGSSLRTNKLRSLLTLLGVIIGIASVIAIMTIGSGLRQQTVDSLDSFGASNMTVRLQERDSEEPDNPYAGGIDAYEYPDSLMSADLLNQVSEQLGPSLNGYSLHSYLPYSAELEETNTLTGLTSDVYVEGVNEYYLPHNGMELKAGRNFSADDIAAERPVTIISESLLLELFSGDTERALNSDVTLTVNNDSHTFTVIGVSSDSGGAGMLSFTDTTAKALLPIGTVQDLGDEPVGFTSATFRPAQDADPTVVRSQLQAFFDNAYAQDQDVRAAISDFSGDVDQVNDVISSISLAISAIAGISLLVGGIGVMNIMLVSVTERTREIGIRKALGATRGNIRLQFVTEAMIVCLVGGVIGVVLGGLIGYAGSSAFNAAALPPLGAVLFALLFSLGIGVFFGYYPAAKAAKLDPITALRHE